MGRCIIGSQPVGLDINDFENAMPAIVEPAPTVFSRGGHPYNFRHTRSCRRVSRKPKDGFPIKNVGNDRDEGSPINNVRNDREDGFPIINVGNDGDDGISSSASYSVMPAKAGIQGKQKESGFLLL